MAKKSIFCVGENITPFNDERVYVRATDGEMRSLVYSNGCMLLVCYPCEANNVDSLILPMSDFKDWRNNIIARRSSL